jgi:hypothetical protein
VGVFYPEKSTAGWFIPWMDGQERLFDFAIDPRGYIYLAASQYHWGVLEDRGITGTGSGLASLFQWYPGVSAPEGLGEATPHAVVTGKSAGRQYLLVGGTKPTDVFDVEDPAAPVFIRTLPDACIGPGGWTQHVQLKVGSVDLVATTCNSDLRIYSFASLVAGSAAPLVTIPASHGPFGGVVTDGQRLFAVASKNVSGVRKGTLAIASPTIAGDPASFAAAFHPLGDLAASRLNHHDGVLFLGDHQGRFKILRLEGELPVELPNSQFLMRYYVNNSLSYAVPAGYTAPFQSAVVDVYEGTRYLIYSQYGLGDLYELDDLWAGPVVDAPDAGVVDAGIDLDAGPGAVDGGAPLDGGATASDVGAGSDAVTALGTCGCGFSSGPTAALALVAFLVVGRRRGVERGRSPRGSDPGR